AEGDTVTIVFGDRAQGGPGMRAQTFAETEFEFKVLVDAFGSGLYYELPSSPVISVIGGYPDAVHVVVPSQVVVGEPFAAGVRVVDSFGNPSRFFAGEITLTGPTDVFQERTVHLTA